MCHSFRVLMGLILHLGLSGQPWGGEGGPCRSLWEWVIWSISSPSLQRWVQWSKLYQASLPGTFSWWMEEKFPFLLVRYAHIRSGIATAIVLPRENSILRQSRPRRGSSCANFRFWRPSHYQNVPESSAPCW